MTTIRQELQSLVGRVAALEYESLHKIHWPMVIDLCVIDLQLERVHTFAQQHMKLASDCMKWYDLSSLSLLIK